MKKRLISFIIIMSSLFCVQAQIIGGTIFDAETGDPIPDCLITLSSSNAFSINQYSTIDGNFTFEVFPGDFKLSFTYLGYEKYTTTVTIDHGSTINNIIELTPDPFSLQNLVITSSALKVPQEIRLNKDIFLRLPGAFNDPSRLLTRFPSIAITNDQANQITVKGLPPHATNWFVNSAVIINPNHLSNAGSITDQASSSGGGVNMISGSSINTFSFLSTPYKQRYYDSPAGLSNFTLKIPEGLQYALGILGTEVSFAKTTSKKFNFGINYRYSTLGILSALGVELGDEIINFQDLHIHLDQDIGKHNVSLDIVAGENSNVHNSLGDESLLLKDALDITFEGQQIIGSINHKYLKEKTSIENTINYSQRKANRIASIDSTFDAALFTNRKDELIESSFALSNHYSYFYNDVLSITLDNQSVSKTINIQEQNESLFHQYNMIGFEYFHNKITLKGGLGLSHYNNKIFNPEVRLDTRYNINHHALQFKYSNQANSILPEIYLYDNSLEPYQSNNYSLDYFYSKNKSLFQAGFFYHDFQSIPVSQTNYVSYFDRLDLIINEINTGQLEQNGTAEILGFQEQFEYLFFNAFQCIQALSIYDMTVIEDGKSIESTFDFGYTFAFTISTHHKTKKKNKILYSISLLGRGAGNDLAIDRSLSENTNQTRYITSTDKSRLQDPYFRIDAKIDYLFGKRNQHRLSLDIQNIINRRNDAYSYYDPLTERIELQSQLGLIPILKFTSKVF